jgi:hypothetical protein
VSRDKLLAIGKLQSELYGGEPQFTKPGSVEEAPNVLGMRTTKGHPEPGSRVRPDLLRDDIGEGVKIGIVLASAQRLRATRPPGFTPRCISARAAARSCRNWRVWAHNATSKVRSGKGKA